MGTDLDVNNLQTFFVDVVTITAAGTAEQFPDHPILDGVELRIRALPDNTDDVYIGNSSANASGTDRITLSPGESVGLRIANSILIYGDVAVSGEGFEVFAEGPGAS